MMLIKNVASCLFIIVVFFCSNALANQLGVKYSEPESEPSGGQDDFYGRPAVVIDNHAYLKAQSKKESTATSSASGSAPVIILNNSSTSRNYGVGSRRYGKYGYTNDDSWAVGYSSGDTSFFYANGLRLYPKTIVVPYYKQPRPGKPNRPVYPELYEKQKRSK